MRVMVKTLFFYALERREREREVRAKHGVIVSWKAAWNTGLTAQAW